MHKYESRKDVIQAAVVGARGYSGLELCRLLLRHPMVQLKACLASNEEFRLSHYLSEVAAQNVPTWKAIDLNQVQNAKLNVVFLATPADVSIKLAPQYLKLGLQVIDLSGAFRLSHEEDVLKWYGLRHERMDLSRQAHFGLQPWAKPFSRETQLISNPGCFATAVLMATLPLIKEKKIQLESLVIDAKSGTSGAGRKALEPLLFTEVDGECRPYKVGQHQHWPEIVKTIYDQTGESASPFFTTHLINVRRGIEASIYAQTSASEDEIEECLFRHYERYPLIRIARLGSLQGESLLSLKRVVGSARTHLVFRVLEKKLFMFSLIDNLIKGAAGQAIENLNCLNDWPVELGLEDCEGVL